MFVHTTGFTHGEVDESLYDRVDVDFYDSASKYILNWFPDLSGALERRPGWQMAEVIGSGSTLFTQENVRGEAATIFSFRGTDYLVVFLLMVDMVNARTVTFIRVFVCDISSLASKDQFTVSLLNIAGTENPLDNEPVKFADIPLVNYPSGEYVPPKPFNQMLSFASVGPSLFIASSLFPVMRIFVNLETVQMSMEPVRWYQELVGTVQVDHGSTIWRGTDTLFNEDLEVGSVFRYKDKNYTVARFLDNDPEKDDDEEFEGLSDTEKANQQEHNQKVFMQTDEPYEGPSVSGERISKPIANPFDKDSPPNPTREEPYKYPIDYPSLVTFHKGRLHLFSTPNRPTTWWASKSQDPFVIRAGSVYDDSPIEYDLLTEGADQFLWCQSLDGIYLGGSRAEYLISSPSDSPLTPTQFSFRKVSSVGGSAVRSFVSEASIRFVNRSRTQLYSIRFSDASQGFIEQDLSILAPHLLANGVKDVAYRPPCKSDRVPRIFVLDDTNQLCACALLDSQNISAWSRVSVPIALTPVSLVSSPDNVFVITKDAGGSYYRILRLEEPDKRFWVADCTRVYVTYRGASTIQVDPLFKNKPVAVGTEAHGFIGYMTPDDAGRLDLTSYTSEEPMLVYVGFAFDSKLIMLPASMQDAFSSYRLNTKRRVIRVLVSIKDTYQLYVCGHSLSGSDILKRMKNGVHEVRLLGWGYQDQVFIDAYSIYKAKILSITREVV